MNDDARPPQLAGLTEADIRVIERSLDTRVGSVEQHLAWVMRDLKGQANPAEVLKVIREKLYSPQ